jgi:tRNA(Ile)-lysidine synthase
MMAARLALSMPSGFELRGARFVLAVSGGLDSMVLLDAMTSRAADAAYAAHPDARWLVATFDHGTGPAARAAVDLVRETTLARGLSFVSGTPGATADARATEEAWRDARWKFLRAVAGDHAQADGSPATICTAHTRNDQIETVLMRAMRDAGARGLAGLEAPSAIARPLLGATRAEIAAYARERALRWVEDPSNESSRYMRNRVRGELLPALEAARPGLGQELVEIGRDAGQWRRELDAVLDRAITMRPRPRGLDVARDDLAGYPRESIAMLWAAVAARAGLVLDRRGAVRATDFILRGRSGARIQFSGDWELTRRRDWFELRRTAPLPARAANPEAVAGVSP